jgi:tRNA pseudouridine55 synthase
VIDGLAVVDKPAGMTSHDVVARCRRIFAQRKVGHAGTLDPDATGLLLVGLGRATRLLRFVSGMDKAYTAEVVLGVATSTLDASGEVVGTWDMRSVTVEEAAAAAASLTGPIEQVPPMVSAVRVGGRRLHELARQGIEVARPARPVTVHHLAVTAAPGADPGRPGAGPVLALSVRCSSGTYVRSLAADLGSALGGGAHLRALRRTAVGPWTLADAVALDRLDARGVRPPAEALAGMVRVHAGAALTGAVGNGRVLGRDELGVEGPGPWAVVGGDGALLAVYADHGEGRVKPLVVLAASES